LRDLRHTGGDKVENSLSGGFDVKQKMEAPDKEF
jgi:hypothetical protein